MIDAVSIADVYPSGAIWLRETGLRDGLQLVSEWPSTEAKRQWVAIDRAAGVRHFEAGSYLPPSAFPQFADVDDVIDAVNGAGGWSSALVLNLKGAERALLGRAHELNCVVSASEPHNLRNARRTREESIADIERMLSLRAQAQRCPLVAVGIAMAFGCSIAGRDAIAPDDVARIAERVVAAGADLIGIADTVGYANPATVRVVIRELRRAIGETPIMLHLHDTRGLGLTNAAAALDEGIVLFDASLAGLGGCPFAPNAAGNVVLEDLAYLCRSMGFACAIDPDALLPARAILAAAMSDEPLHGRYNSAGAPILSARPAVQSGKLNARI